LIYSGLLWKSDINAIGIWLMDTGGISDIPADLGFQLSKSQSLSAKRVYELIYSGLLIQPSLACLRRLDTFSRGMLDDQSSLNL
jgi:hypothetical protein